MSAQFIPTVVGDAPVLAPLLGERIHFENFLRRRATAPIQIEDGSIGPYIRAEPAYAERDVAHQINLFLGTVSFERLPLAKGQPLDVHEKKLLAHQVVAAFLRQRD